jgi:AcrR family transcriptional regulator
MAVKTRKAEQSEVTRAVLVRTARELFSERGFAETPTEEIVKRAGITRGALYHHFRDKEDLFRAVVEDVEAELVRHLVTAASRESDPLARFRAGSHSFLKAALDPDVQRLVLNDAPSVLGLAAWREIDDRHGLGFVRGGLEAAMKAGQIAEQPLDPLANILLGALKEAAMLIAQSPTNKSKKEMTAIVDRLIDGLRKTS